MVCISDTHTKLAQIILPEGDLLIHAGDATFRGTIQEISQFNEDLGKIKHLYKHGVIFVPGNHDVLFEKHEYLAKSILTNAKVLIDDWTIIENKLIYGSPWQPEFNNWSFGLPRDSIKLQDRWDNIPDNADIVITHGPVNDILDECVDGFRAGCKLLYKRIVQIKPELFVSGHIHHSYGMHCFNGTTFINASICQEDYQPLNLPIEIILDE